MIRDGNYEHECPRSDLQETSVPEGQSVDPVLLVTPWYSPTLGGVSEVAKHLFSLLSNAGLRTHLLISDEELRADIRPAGEKDTWRGAIPAYAFGKATLRTIAATVIFGLLGVVRLHRFLKNHAIHTIVLIYPQENAWAFLLARHLLPVRLIVSLHGNDTTHYAQFPVQYRWLFRRLIRSADAVTVCAEHLATRLHQLVPEARAIRLIPNCVDTTRFVPAAAKPVDAPPTLVHVSNFTQKKRTCDIVEAFASARIPAQSRLLMVGAGPELPGTIAAARRHGVSERVHFVGAQSDVRPFLRLADLFVLASDDEGAPLALLESMACGLPWVSTPWGPAASLPQGECGLTVPSGSPAAMAQAISDLINDPGRRARMGERGRRRAEQDYGEAKYLEEHLRVLAAVHLDDRRPGTRPCGSRSLPWIGRQRNRL